MRRHRRTSSRSLQLPLLRDGPARAALSTEALHASHLADSEVAHALRRRAAAYLGAARKRLGPRSDVHRTGEALGCVLLTADARLTRFPAFDARSRLYRLEPGADPTDRPRAGGRRTFTSPVAPPRALAPRMEERLLEIGYDGGLLRRDALTVRARRRPGSTTAERSSTSPRRALVFYTGMPASGRASTRMPPAAAVGVVVLGMGRSGTSAVSRMFVRAGFFAGAEDDLLGAHESNPLGHFENLGIMNTNERILAELGGSWFDPPARERPTGLGGYARGAAARAPTGGGRGRRPAGVHQGSAHRRDGGLGADHRRLSASGSGAPRSAGDRPLDPAPRRYTCRVRAGSVGAAPRRPAPDPRRADGDRHPSPRPAAGRSAWPAARRGGNDPPRAAASRHGLARGRSRGLRAEPVSQPGHGRRPRARAHAPSAPAVELPLLHGAWGQDDPRSRGAAGGRRLDAQRGGSRDRAPDPAAGARRARRRARRRTPAHRGARAGAGRRARAGALRRTHPFRRA